MKTDTGLCRTFVEFAKSAMSKYPQIKHQWPELDEVVGRCVLEIPNAEESGFPVRVDVWPDRIMVSSGLAHTTLDLEDDSEILAKEAMSMAFHLLTPKMRIRERLAGGKPYKASFEYLEKGKWVTAETTVLLFWNYFGKRSERIYQNHLLLAQEDES